MAVSIKTTSLDNNYHSGRNVTHTSAIGKSMYTEMERGKHNFVKFAREKGQSDHARVKLSLSNNSRRLVEWIIKDINENIQAIPKASGLVKAFDTGECILIWRRPKDYNSWRELSPLKMILQIKLMVSETGKVVGEANSKFRASVDPHAVCTAEEPPIHNIILNSEPSTMILRKEKPKKKTDVNSEIQPKIMNKNFLDDSQNTYWILILLFCLLIAICLKVLSD
ncbi:unnamed protein product [Brugia timori]|uniref:Major sperm protein n=1 Tax=Brugia timori TaxID=42155 RepID=A0A0R3QSM4_9BILA|nr:unnamed protein product [Brugia timori]